MTTEGTVNSWRYEVIADSSGKWYGNAVFFASEKEAKEAAAAKAAVWTLVMDTRVVPSDNPPNSRWDAEASRAVALDTKSTEKPEKSTE